MPLFKNAFIQLKNNIIVLLSLVGKLVFRALRARFSAGDVSYLVCVTTQEVTGAGWGEAWADR